VFKLNFRDKRKGIVLKVYRVAYSLTVKPTCPRGCSMLDTLRFWVTLQFTNAAVTIVRVDIFNWHLTF